MRVCIVIPGPPRQKIKLQVQKRPEKGSTSWTIFSGGGSIQVPRIHAHPGLSKHRRRRRSHQEGLRGLRRATGLPIFYSKTVSKHAKCVVYVGLVLAILLHGSESWCLTEIPFNRLRSFHARCVRTMSRITLSMPGITGSAQQSCYARLAASQSTPTCPGDSCVGPVTLPACQCRDTPGRCCRPGSVGPSETPERSPANDLRQEPQQGRHPRRLLA